MIIITTVDHHVKQAACGGSVNQQQISRLSDVLQLQELKAIYCETADACVEAGSKAADRFSTLFTEDVHADFGMGPLEGRAAVIAFLVEAIITTNETLWHTIHTPRIDVRGDTATGHWTVMVRMRHKGSSSSEILYGRYVDEFRRTPEGWRLSSVRFTQEPA
jgi:ketosteroid isomerase-like protein